MFRFTIRELVLLTLVVAMGVGWWLDRRHSVAERAKVEHFATSLAAVLEDDGWKIEWEREFDRLTVQSHDGRTRFTLTPDSFRTIPTTLRNEAETNPAAGAVHAASPTGH